MVLGGCAHYQLGLPGDLPFTSIFVKPVQNHSLAPQADALVTQNLREAFIRDGSLQLRPESGADVTLTVTLTRYERERAAVQESDSFLGRSYSVTLQARITIVDNRNGDVYMDKRNVEANDVVYVDGGLTQAEYHVMPVLAERLASKIRNAVISIW